MSTDLLGIDAAAGVRLIGERQLGAAWQIPAELVRLALANGADEVAVSLKRGRFTLRAPGARLDGTLLELLAGTIEGGDGLRVMTCVEGLEQRDGAVLLWAARAASGRFRIEAPALDGSGVVLSVISGKSRVRPSIEAHGLRVDIDRAKFDVGRAARWITRACRFVRGPVLLEGQDVRRPLASGCFRAECTAPLPMVVALGVASQWPMIWMLRDGVVQGRASVPGWPAFDAAVELKGEIEGQASARDLRQVLSRHLPGIIESAVSLMIRVAPQLPTLTAERQQRLRLALLLAVSRRVCGERIRRLGLFDLLGPTGRRLVSIDELAHIADGRALRIAEDADAVSSEHPVVLAGEREAVALRGILGSAMLWFPRRRRWLLGGWTKRLRQAVRRAVTVLRSRPVEPVDLEPAEVQLAKRLESSLAASGETLSVVFDRGVRKVSRCSGRVLLPRNDPLVGEAVHLVAHDSQWLYPAALALLGDQCEIDPEVRLGWLFGGDEGPVQHEGGRA